MDEGAGGEDADTGGEDVDDEEAYDWALVDVEVGSATYQDYRE